MNSSDKGHEEDDSAYHGRYSHPEGNASEQPRSSPVLLSHRALG